MNLNKKEIEFIKYCIEHYWEDWNRDHPDNEKKKKISDKLVKKLTIPVVVGQSEQLPKYWQIKKELITPELKKRFPSIIEWAFEKEWWINNKIAKEEELEPLGI